MPAGWPVPQNLPHGKLAQDLWHCYQSLRGNSGILVDRDFSHEISWLCCHPAISLLPLFVGVIAVARLFRGGGFPVDHALNPRV